MNLTNEQNTSETNLVILASCFNRDISDALIAGAQHYLYSQQIEAPVMRVAGAFELPVAAGRLIADGAKGVIALGCVIRGDTVHFDYVCRGCTDGLMRVMLDYGVPIGFGVLMTETVAQARLRASLTVVSPAGDHAQEMNENNKGYEAAEAVVTTLRSLAGW